MISATAECNVVIQTNMTATKRTKHDLIDCNRSTSLTRRVPVLIHIFFSSLSAFAVTSTVAPVSARMAIQSPVAPITVVIRNTALSPSANATF